MTRSSRPPLTPPEPERVSEFPPEFVPELVREVTSGAGAGAARGAARPEPVSEPSDADEATSAEAPEVLEKKELLDRVVARSGVRRRDAKPAVEAALAILGSALAEGRDLRLEPLGKLKVTNVKTRGGKRVIHVRLRQNAPCCPESSGDGPQGEAAQDAGD